MSWKRFHKTANVSKIPYSSTIGFSIFLIEKCSFMGAKRKNELFQENTRSWAENDSNLFFTRNEILYFEVGNSQNRQNLSKLPYSTIGFSRFSIEKCSFMGAMHKNELFQKITRSWAENDSNSFFQEKWILYFAVEDSQNSQNPSKVTYSTMGFSIFLMENAHSWAQGIKTKFSRKVLAHGLKTRHTYVHPNILSMSKVNETHTGTEMRRWWGAVSEINSVSARTVECIVFTHSELNKDWFSDTKT